MANIVEGFLALSNAKKIVYISILAASIGAAALLFQWASQPEYQLLYSNLSQEDSAVIVEKLKEKRIPYKIGGGGIVMVPGEKVHEVRLELAGAGLPKGGGVGLEIFDKTGFGMTEFTQKVNYMRAIQGELARTIAWLSEVETARVHIVIPEKRLFSADEEKPRASIAVKLKQGRKLDYGQVQGITHLVASSVAGLSPQNITVVDTSGQMLTRATDGDGMSVLTSSQLEYQRGLERDMEKRIQTILEPVVGVGKVIARVAADINFTRVEKTEEKFDPDNVVVRSEQKTKEKSAGEMTAGVPGVASNIPGGQPSQGAQTPQNTPLPPQSQRQNDIINYEINKVVSRTIEPTGALKRVSVSVLVDGSYEIAKTAKGKEERKYLARKDEEMKKFEGIVKGVIGFAVERGDKVEVVNIPFETQAQIEGEAKPESAFVKEYLPYIIRYGTIIGLSMLLFLFVLRPLITGLLKQEAGGAPGAGLPAEMLKTLELGAAQHALTPPSVDTRQRVMELAKTNPQQAAQIIKAWVKEK
ncbi:MAG: flagellar M-ring protein FliF [Deltaproteobacteria bacterium]|nr:flagellar M-ring protein FliF [Deltaproteobacteria bacterium]